MGEKKKVQRAPLPWYRWVLAVILFGGAGAVAVRSYVGGVRSDPAVRVVKPRPIRIASTFEPVGTVPVQRGELEGYNVLFVTYDTTRADRIGCYGHDGIETPAIDGVARDGVLFTTALAPSPVTLPSHSSLMTGLYPYRHGARANKSFRLSDDNLTIAEILTGQGYRTAAMVSTFVLDKQFGLDQGFGHYDDDVEQPDDEDLVSIAQRRGDETNGRARTWLREHGSEKFFMWVHYYDPHHPYEAPEPFADRYDLAYDAEIAFTDAQLGRLLAVLDELQIADRTIVVVAGDHGEGLGEHDEFFHSAMIYESTLRVPLVMRWGKSTGNGLRIDRPVSLVDVMPTVLTMLGLDVPGDLDGIDLTRPAAGDRAIFSETLQGLADHGWASQLGVHVGGMKLILGGEPELYDLAADPHERNNIAEAESVLVAALQSRMTGFFGEDLSQAATAEPTHHLGAEDLAKLQALGYLSTISGTVDPDAARPHPRDMMPLLMRLQRAEGFEKTHGLDEMIRKLEALADDRPEFATVFCTLGDAYRRYGQPDLAEEAYAQCLELRPTDTGPLLSLASLKLATRHIDDAITLYEQVLQRYPDQFVALGVLATIHRTRGEFDEAIEYITRALDVQPHDVRLPTQYLDTMVDLARVDEAVAFMQAHLDQRPNLPMMRNELARAHMIRREHAEAIEALATAVELAPLEYEVKNNLAFILATCPDESLRRPFEAAILMEHVCEATGYRDPRFMHTLAMAYGVMRRVDEGLAVARRARMTAATSDDPRFNGLATEIGRTIQRLELMSRQGISPVPAMRPRKEPESPEDHSEQDPNGGTG
ncbi:MAG: sulfatase-like hydrolase/transferase [Planctomycetes bacterium]|nr:sulfatase-like hydrolase/transferase [Planctomycetota bacterium]